MATTTTNQQSSIRPVVQAASILLSTALAGGSLAVSSLVIPRLLESPTPLMLRQWSRMFDATKVVFPGGSALVGLAYLYLGYTARAAPAPARGGYLAAAALCVGFLPYTLVAVMPTNKALARRVEEVEARGLADGVEVEVLVKENGVAVENWEDDKSSKWLVDHWGIVSLPRAAMLGLAGAIGAWVSI